MIQPQSLFDSLSDAIRRRLLALILEQGELCVCELTAALDMPQPKISRHLAVMREAGILTIRREGTWIHYRLDAQLPLWAYQIMETAARDAPESESGDDRLRLAQMAAKPAKCAS
ncbi:MAG: metalloregulator ArsR/SmtB family transcription factor [Betaproteobacteria bacterium]|nr:metalloregulator ArsR/SmtB family transcription factor [Betaproteobacteria bacterium]